MMTVLRKVTTVDHKGKL